MNAKEKYINELENFYSNLDYNPISSDAKCLYQTILHMFYKQNWIRTIKISNNVLIAKTGLTLSGLQRKRNELQQKGYINYFKGNNQAALAKYELLSHNEQAIAQANEQATEQASEQASEQQNEHIITILYLLFNYLINNSTQKNFKMCDGKEITSADKNGIINILKKLDIYMTKELLKTYPASNLLDIEIQYYVVSALYLSPYKIYINNLTREEFMLRFLKTKKYIENEDVLYFINYFIKSLQEEFMKKEKIYVVRTNESMGR